MNQDTDKELMDVINKGIHRLLPMIQIKTQKEPSRSAIDLVIIMIQSKLASYNNESLIKTYIQTVLESNDNISNSELAMCL